MWQIDCIIGISNIKRLNMKLMSLNFIGTLVFNWQKNTHQKNKIK